MQRDRDEAPGPAPQWPYAAAPAAELETMRRDHIKAETNIRGLGALILFGGLISLFAVAAAAYTTLLNHQVDPVGLLSVESLVGLPVSVAYVVAGIKLRKLEVRGRQLFTVTYILSFLIEMGRVGTAFRPPDLPDALVLGMLAFSLGVNAFFLSIVWSKKARTVFTEHYRQVVIPATPHVRYRSRLLPVLLVVIALTAGGLAVAALATC